MTRRALHGLCQRRPRAPSPFPCATESDRTSLRCLGSLPGKWVLAVSRHTVVAPGLNQHHSQEPSADGTSRPHTQETKPGRPGPDAEPPSGSSPAIGHQRQHLTVEPSHAQPDYRRERLAERSPPGTRSTAGTCLSERTRSEPWQSHDSGTPRRRSTSIAHFTSREASQDRSARTKQQRIVFVQHRTKDFFAYTWGVLFSHGTVLFLARLRLSGSRVWGRVQLWVGW